MKIIAPKFWKKKGFLSYWLLPFSALLQLLIKIKTKFVKKNKFKIPIICVGNIYIGGTGKTPLCLKLNDLLKLNKKKPAVVKKFYKQHHDEFSLMQDKNIDLFINTKRIVGINDAISNNFDVVILDDGFQDDSIYKNLNILCFNDKQLAGNEMTIPSGPLREPLHAIKKCQIVLINGMANEFFEKKIKNINDKASIYYSEYLLSNIDSFKDKNLLAFAGIGNPENFFNLLEKNNLKVEKKVSFPDHYDYSIKELNELINYGEKNNLEIITTEKDYFRIRHHRFKKIKFSKITLEINKKEKFIKEVLEYL